MTTRIEEFVAHLGWEVDPGELEEFEKQVDGIADTFKKVAIAVGTATAALTAAVVVTNKQTAELNNLAKAVGVTTEFLIGMGGVVSEIGFDTEKVVDLVEEMNNKFGEKAGLGKMTAVEDAVKLLKLDFEEIRKLEPEKQFIRLLDAAKRLENQQQAVSAIDMLMGGEGNKILGLLRNVEGSMDEIIGRRLELNFLSQKGIEQATKFNTLWGETSGVITSVWAQFAGLVGGAITPILEQFTKWVRLNRKLIQQKIVLWAEKTGKALQFIFKNVKDLITFVKKVTDGFGGLGNSLKLLAIIFTSFKIFKFVKALQLMVPLLLGAARATSALSVAMKTIGVPIAVIAIAALILAIDELITWFKGGDTVLGEFGEKIADWASDATDDIDEFFGRSRGSTRLWISQFADGLSEGFTTAWKHVSGFIESLRAITWSEIADTWVNIFKSAADKVAGFFLGVLKKARQMVNGVIGEIKSLGRRIPLIGDLISPEVIAGANGINGAAGAAAIAAPAGAVGRQIQNTLNRTQGGNTRIDMRNNIRIAQRPGESSADLAQRVKQVMEEQMAEAVRNNDTGIER